MNLRGSRSNSSFLISMVFISLYLSFFNKIPIYPLFVYLVIMFLIVLLPVTLETNNKIYKFQFILFILFIYFILSALVSGVPLHHIFSFNFLRRDGNFFITYAPLLILPFLKNYIKIEKINFLYKIKLLLIFQSIITILLILLIFLINYSCEGRCKVCHFLFEAHNAAGGYYMIFSLLSFFYWKFQEKKSNYFIIIFLANIYALYLTNSRGSEITLLIVLLYYLYERQNLIILSRITTLLIIVTSLYIYMVGYSVYINHMHENINLGERSYTILSRVFVSWPEAIHDFFISPLFGIGFSRYNDPSTSYEGIKYLIYLNNSSTIIDSAAHAHNSFLHILAENGIVGFILFLYLFKLMFKIIKKFYYFDKFNYFFLKYALLAIIISGLTEHRWTTPSETLPYMIYFSIAIVYLNTKEKYENIIYQRH